MPMSSLEASRVCMTEACGTWFARRRKYLFARCLLAAALRQAPLPVSSRHRGIPRFSPTLSGCISTAETAQDARVGRRRWDIWFITLNVHSRPCDQTGNPILHHPRPLASFQPLSWESAEVTESPTPDWISPASLGKWPGGASEGILGPRGCGVGIVCTRGIRACIFPNAARGGGTLGLIP
jgi:hypothetical protein